MFVCLYVCICAIYILCGLLSLCDIKLGSFTAFLVSLCHSQRCCWLSLPHSFIFHFLSLQWPKSTLLAAPYSTLDSRIHSIPFPRYSGRNSPLLFPAREVGGKSVYVHAPMCHPFTYVCTDVCVWVSVLSGLCEPHGSLAFVAAFVIAVTALFI